MGRFAYTLDDKRTYPLNHEKNTQLLTSVKFEKQTIGERTALQASSSTPASLATAQSSSVLGGGRSSVSELSKIARKIITKPID